MASEGMSTAGAPKGRPPMFSRTSAPQSAIRRLHAEAEEGQAGEQQHDEDEAQAEVGEHRAEDVGQDLRADEIGGALAAGAGDGDEVHGVDVDRERAGEAVGAGSVDDGERQRSAPGCDEPTAATTTRPNSLRGMEFRRRGSG